MKINRKPELITNNGLIIAGVVVVTLIAIGLITWSLMATSAEQSFASRLAQTKEDSLKSIAQQTTQLFEVAKSSDRTKVANFLESFAASVDADVVNIPVQTYITGIPLVGQARIEQAETVKSALNDLAAALHDSAALATYQLNIVDPLVSIKGLVGSTLSDQNQLAATWANIVKQLASMQTPEAVKDVHVTLYNLSVSISQALNQLVEATKKHDQRLHTAIANALSGYIGQLHSLGPTFQEIHKKSDADVGNALKAAEAALQ